MYKQMINRPNFTALAVFLSVGLTLFWIGCIPPNPSPPDGNDNNNDNSDPTAREADCVGCHTNETMLKLVQREEPEPPADTGEG